MRYINKFYKHPEIKYDGHILVGSIWPVRGSKGDAYSVTMHSTGFECDCAAFTFRRKCKHIDSVVERLVA
jgi:uncharacterized Zn finger protein